MGAARIVVPAMPEPAGPSPQKTKFFLEVAAGLEMLAMFYTLTAEEQAEFIQLAHGFAAAAAERSPRK